VQHHFGDKDGILVAVVEDSFNRFAARLADIPESGSSLRERVELFVDRAWAHFSSPEYRSTFEILLNALGRDEAVRAPRWQERMFRAWDALWMRLFRDAPVSRRRQRLLEHYTIATLSGLASTLVLEGPAAKLRPEELDLLKGLLARELEAGPA
jgi:AcrR family transcriptional regulator